MKKVSIAPPFLSIMGLICLVASTSAMTSYLRDPNGPRFSPPPLVRIALEVIGWGTVFATAYHNRVTLRRPNWRMFVPVLVIEALLVCALRPIMLPCLAPVAVQQYNALQIAVTDNDFATVTRLLAHHCPPEDVVLPRDQVRDQISYDEFPHKFPRRPLYVAVVNGNVAIATALLDHGARVTLGDSSLLSMSAVNANIPMMHLLIQRGAPVNTRDGGSLALRAAVDCGATASVAYLLNQGANPNHEFRGLGGPSTVLQQARQRQETDIVNLLLHAGATF